jgi:hypothetical protein
MESRKNDECNILVNSKNVGTIDKNMHFYVKSIVVLIYYDSVHPIYVF